MPVVAAPMFLISGPQLVIECCKQGVGTFPALNQRTTDGFESWIIEIKETLAAFEAETGKRLPWSQSYCSSNQSSARS